MPPRIQFAQTMEDRERWQLVDGAVDAHFARLESDGVIPGVLPGDESFLGAEGEVGLRLERFLSLPEGGGLLDLPLEARLGELLDSAVTEGALAGLGPGDRVGAYREPERRGVATTDARGSSHASAIAMHPDPVPRSAIRGAG